jgi:hypothetical protein
MQPTTTEQPAADDSAATAPLPMIPVKKAAAWLGLSAAYLNRLRVTGGSPAYHRVGRRILYSYADLSAWIASRRRTSTTDTGEGKRDG